MTTLPMTVPLWCLALLIFWTMTIVAGLMIQRGRFLSNGGDARYFSVADDKSSLWRLFRAHQNSVENLVLFASIVFIIEARGVDNGTLNWLAITYVVARLTHSTIHIMGWNPLFRVLMLFIQGVCLLGMLGFAVFT